MLAYYPKNSAPPLRSLRFSREPSRITLKYCTKTLKTIKICQKMKMIMKCLAWPAVANSLKPRA